MGTSFSLKVVDFTEFATKYKNNNEGMAYKSLQEQ